MSDNTVQLMMFPGWKSPPPAEGEEKMRLDVTIVIKVKDNKTGEKFAREIHQDFTDGTLVVESIQGALEHHKIVNEVHGFCSPRRGWPESVKEMDPDLDRPRGNLRSVKVSSGGRSVTMIENGEGEI